MTTLHRDSQALRTRVDVLLPNLTPIGRRVALLLVDEYERLGFHSASQLARMSGTSDATVIRTVQQLGYAGLIELKREAAERAAPPTPTQRLRTTLAEEAHIGDDEMEPLGAQLRALDRLHQPAVREAIGRAVRAFAGADRVFVNARGVSMGIAIHGAAQLKRIGLDARTLGSAAGLTGDDLLGIRPHDVVLVIASGLQQRWQGILYQRCEEAGANVVLITDAHPQPTPNAVVIRAGRGRPAGFATHVPTIATIEAIVLGIANLDQTTATRTLDDLNRHRQRLMD
jgi:DNA-binding MurR/RpiR family transcriptional regulator